MTKEKYNKLIYTERMDNPTESKENRYPKIGPFYFYQNFIITPDEYQRKINPITFMLESFYNNLVLKEHRDMWDRYMVMKYPELKITYDDNHKALPRGRVDYSIKNKKISFFTTLDKCIVKKEDEIKNIYNIAQYDVSFSYGAMNYKCKNCI